MASRLLISSCTWGSASAKGCRNWPSPVASQPCGTPTLPASGPRLGECAPNRLYRRRNKDLQPRRPVRCRQGPVPGPFQQDLPDLKPDHFVVHAEHEIGVQFHRVPLREDALNYSKYTWVTNSRLPRHDSSYVCNSTDHVALT